ncbi:MAG: dihydroorotate dehydrogenase electron transfer subunit [Candidatus Bathyarchaeota archaeon]|nr:dihydroorotate dehydrogenase electron transfer subunit [Candidatus Bathyarchaeota archaeon]
MSAYRIAANTLRTTRILSVKTESPTVRTFTFKDKECVKAKPGQFLMLWIPGVDEIPLSILDANENGTVSVAVKKVGEATQAIHNKEAGEIIGIRGPFGNYFTIKTGRILVVSGGTGTAPLLFLAKKLASEATKLVFVIGAKTIEELLFMDELKRILAKEKTQLIATTEDGSYGIKGIATTPLETVLEKEKFDIIYTCGPEQMMRKVFDLAEKHGIVLEASLERLMRCAIGLCGSCVIGRYRVCKDGPVFNAKQLREVKKEFGISKRDFNGRRIPLE